MANLISNEFWEYFKGIQKDAFESFGKDEIALYRQTFNMDFFGEDPDPATSGLEEIILPVLINYNYYRVWGVNTNSQAGEIEAQSLSVLLNKDVLRELYPTLLDSKDNLVFDSGRDYFIHRGTRYTAQGETFISQASNDPLLIMLILQVDKRFNHEVKGSQE